MKASQKFLFDHAFDLEEADDNGKPAAKRRFSAAELEAARQSAHAAGLAAGLDQAHRGYERQAAQALEEAARQFADLHKQQAMSNQMVQRNAVEVAISVVRKLFPGLEARDGLAEIERLVTDSLQRIPDQPRVVVRVNDALMPALQGRLQHISNASAFPGQLVLLADDRLGRGDCRVEWADGGAERLGERIWAEIDAAIERAQAVWRNGAATTAPGADTAGTGPATEGGEFPGDAADDTTVVDPS